LRILGASSDLESSTLRVREVHRRALNLEGPRGERYSLVTGPSMMGPRSALVDRLPVLPEGEMVKLEGGWDATYDPSLAGLRPRGRWRPLWLEWLELMDDPDLEVLRGPVRSGELMGLVGLGPGHTPAGDDLITGWLAARWTLGDLESTSRFLEGFDPGLTTWLGGDQMTWAARGFAWAPLKGLLSALSSSDPEGILDALGELEAVGHTSGRSCLVGLALGLEGAMEV